MNQDNKHENFFDAWAIYRKVIENNYMYHDEIIRAVKEKLSDKKSLFILDLGCGDSYVISNSIVPEQLKNYLGIDISESALDFSKQNLINHKANIAHIAGDLLFESVKLNSKFDVVMAGYSIHHLDTEEKDTCFSKISDLLTEQGVFIFYGLMSREEETAFEYNTRACNIFKNDWRRMNEVEIEGITSHVMENDCPENNAFYLETWAKHGLVNIEKSFQDQNDLFVLYFIRK